MVHVLLAAARDTGRARERTRRRLEPACPDRPTLRPDPDRASNEQFDAASCRASSSPRWAPARRPAERLPPDTPVRYWGTRAALTFTGTPLKAAVPDRRSTYRSSVTSFALTPACASAVLQPSPSR